MPIRWDAKALRYRAESGRFVKRASVTGALERARDASKARVLALGEQLKAGKINLPQFALSFRDEIKALHLLSGGIAQGGKNHLSPSVLGKIGADTRQQYEYANRLIREVASGRQSLDARFFQRLGMYAAASHGTFVDSERRMYRGAGFDEERNVLHAAEHCEDCLGESAKGWVAIGTLKRVGGRVCRVNDACEIVYRKAA